MKKKSMNATRVNLLCEKGCEIFAVREKNVENANIFIAQKVRLFNDVLRLRHIELKCLK